MELKTRYLLSLIPDQVALAKQDDGECVFGCDAETALLQVGPMCSLQMLV